MTHSNYLFVLPLSSFPILRSLSFFSTVMGIFLCMKIDFIVLFFSVISSSLSGIIWWTCYSHEGFEEGSYSCNLREGLKFSFILFISSEIFFFFSFFWSYFHFYLSPISEIGFRWPPFSLIMFDFIEVPLLNTLILLTSGITVTCSHYYFINSNISLSSIYLLFTFSLGAFFRFFQFLEYSNSFFSYNDRCFGSCFYTLTGFHGIHVIIGRIFLSFVFFRQFISKSSYNSTPLSFELSRWYWHFVDVVWIFLYFFVYVYRCY